MSCVAVTHIILIHILEFTVDHKRQLHLCLIQFFGLVQLCIRPLCFLSVLDKINSQIY